MDLFSPATYAAVRRPLREAETLRDELLISINRAITETHL